MSKENTYLALVIGLFLIIVLVVKQCEKEPKIVVKTVTKTVVDTVKTVEIKEVPKTVYVNKYITKEGDTKIVYVKVKDSSTIEAKQYDTKLESNKATANLKITTTGELLDVSGIITYPELTTTITNYKNKSGLFIYGNAPLKQDYLNAEIGLLYQFKNTVGIMAGVQYDDFTRKANYKVGIAVKIY